MFYWQNVLIVKQVLVYLVCVRKSEIDIVINAGLVIVVDTRNSKPGTAYAVPGLLLLYVLAACANRVGQG
jgi:hypothetical protein